MGYLTDNTPPGRNYAVCQDLYPLRVIVQPGSYSDVKLSGFVQEEIPDVEDWQFSGRRRCPRVPARGKERSVGRVIHPAAWAQNSRRMRPFTEEVVYGFHSELDRAAVTARFDVERLTYRIEDEPSSGQALVVVIP